MLETAIMLLDRAVSVLRARKLDKQELFRNVVTPLFNDLQPVVDDYFSIFRRARELIATSPANQLEEALSEIRIARETGMRSRTQIEAAVNCFQDNIKDERVLLLVRDIGRFFYPTWSANSRSNVLLSHWEEYPARRTKEALLQYVESTLAFLELQWSEIVKSYESLRVYCLVPPKYTGSKQA